MVGVRAANPAPPKQKGFVQAVIDAGITMEGVADLDTESKQLFAGCRDIGDDEVQALHRSWRRRSDVFTEDDRARGARWSELDYAIVFAIARVNVEAPPKARVELLRLVNVGDRDDYYLELQVHFGDACAGVRYVILDFLCQVCHFSSDVFA